MNGVAVWALASAVAAGAIPPAAAPLQASGGALERELQAELGGRWFVTKIPIGSQTRLQGGAIITLDPAASGLVVDTEFDILGRIGYLVPARQPGMLLSRSFHVEPADLTSVLKPGSRVAVVSVEVMDDRVELRLRGPQGEPGKLKLMTGRNFQKQWTLDDVMNFVGRALRIERLERAESLAAEYESLLKELKRLDSAFGTEARATEKVGKAKELLKVLDALVKNRDEFAQVARRPVTEERKAYEGRIRELTQQLTVIEALARTERIASIKASLASAGKEAGRIRASIGSAPATSLEQWSTLSRMSDRWEANLALREALLEQLEAEGEADTAARAGLAQERVELTSTREALARDRSRVELAELEREFGDLERERLRLLDLYTRAFGTPGQSAAADRLVQHLQRMLENRRAARERGSPRAAAQLARIESEMKRVRRQ